MIICTSICANYLPKAMTLAESVKKTNSNTKFIVSLVERDIHPAAIKCPYFDNIILAKDLGFENFDNFIFKHSIVEASTAVKGQLFRYLLDKFPEETKFVYLDPDIMVFSEMIELNQALEEHDIILTPHLLNPGNIEMEISALKHGSYNLGFLAIRRSKESQSFINWWADRLSLYCYDDIPNGIFTDQKWIDLVPGLFNVYILRHHGYNVATWSLLTTKITKKDNVYYAEGMPIRFFHFSGYDSNTFNNKVNQWVIDRNNPIYELATIYENKLNHFGQRTIGSEKWSYNYYNSGEEIEKKYRIMFRDNLNYQKKYDNPFDLSNQILSKEFTQKNISGFFRKIGKAILSPRKAFKFLIKKLKA